MLWKLPSELITQIKKMPPFAAQSQDGKECYKELENDKSFLMLDSTYTFHTISQLLHQCNFTRDSSNLFKSPKVPSRQLLSNSQHNESTLSSTLQPNSTQTQLYFTPTLNFTPGIKSQVKPSLKPLEAGIRVKTLCSKYPHRSVSPTTANHLPEEGGWKKS